MDNITYKSTINSQLTIALPGDNLAVTLKVNKNGQPFIYQFKKQLPKEVQRYFPTAEHVYKSMSNQRNFIADPISGKIYLIVKEDQTVQLMLEEKKVDENLSLFDEGRYISTFDFPDYQDDTPNDQYSKMMIFLNEMEEFKDDFKLKFSLANKKTTTILNLIHPEDDRQEV